jgi:hypothetical protein
MSGQLRFDVELLFCSTKEIQQGLSLLREPDLHHFEVGPGSDRWVACFRERCARARLPDSSSRTSHFRAHLLHALLAAFPATACAILGDEDKAEQLFRQGWEFTREGHLLSNIPEVAHYGHREGHGSACGRIRAGERYGKPHSAAQFASATLRVTGQARFAGRGRQRPGTSPNTARAI